MSAASWSWVTQRQKDPKSATERRHLGHDNTNRREDGVSEEATELLRAAALRPPAAGREREAALPDGTSDASDLVQ